MQEIKRIKYINHVSPLGYKIRISKQVLKTNTGIDIRIFVDETNKIFWIQDLISLAILEKGDATSKQMLYIKARQALEKVGIKVITSESKKGVVRRPKKIKNPEYLKELINIAEQAENEEEA
jgi:hypothetical protein